MKQVRYGFLILGAGLWFFLSNGVRAEEPSEGIEILMNGKQYKTIREYKLEQIKTALHRALAAYNLREFSEDELVQALKDVRKQQLNTPAQESQPTQQNLERPSLNNQAAEEDASGMSALQMQEMLKDYLTEHDTATPLIVDPGKVKSIIIKP